MRFIIACGGTGGHVFPGMATARALQDAGHTATLWLAGKAVERHARPDWPGPIALLETDWARPASPAALLRFPVHLLRAWRRARRLLRADRPAALLAMGSRASLMPVLAARSLGIPVVLHESNVMPGQAVAWLSRLCRVTVALGFAETAAALPGLRTVHTGFPLRRLAPAGPLPGLPPGDAPAILVMGGSQGAVRVNTLARDALIRLHRAGRALRVIHLAGEKEAEPVRAAYAEAGVPAVVFGFLQDMAAAYAAATLAVSRAGAASCAELALFGLPALLIPYPYAGHHQRRNAELLEKHGAALALDQATLTPETILTRIAFLLDNPAALEKARVAARALATPRAAAQLAALLIGTAHATPCKP